MARQLGSLTIDLIAKIGGFTKGMTDAERVADRKVRAIKRQMDQHAKDISAAWSGVSKGIAAGLATLGVGLSAGKLVSITKEVANAGIEIERFAALAGTSAQQFQLFAAGANTVGVTGEKLADIFKDVQDKFGDFAQTGGGEMKDFFETIAPKVGVTIEQFRRLSGGEALQLYYSSLEKANLSQQDMVFYLEAVANDATLLQPLLKENGKEWQRLGVEAQNAGSIMGGRALQASKDYQKASAELDNVMKGLRIEVAEQLLPAVISFLNMLSSEGARSSISTMIGWLGDLARKATETANVIANSSLWGWLQIGAGDSKNVGAAITENERKLKSLQDQRQAIASNRFGALFGDDLATLDGQISTVDSKLKSLYATRNQQEKADKAGRRAMGMDLGLGGLENPAAPIKPLSPVVPPKTPGGKSSGKSQAEKDTEAAAKFLKNLEEQVFKSSEKTAYEQLYFDIQKDGIKLSEKQLQYAEGLAKLLDQAKEDERLRAVRIDEQNALYELQNQLMQQREQYKIEIDTFGKGDRAASEMRERAALLQQQNDAIRQLENDRTNALAKANSEKEIAQVQELYARRIELTKEFHAQQEGLFITHLEDRRIKESDWLAGAESAMATYLENTQNMYDKTKDLATKVFGGMEDALVSLVSTGKADFKGLATSIIADITRINAQKKIANWMGGKEGAASGWMGMIGKFLGWSDGGYTGPGGVHEPAGVVHKGEVVWSQFDIAKAGGVGVVEAMRRGIAGYARGGAVGLPRAVTSGMLVQQGGGAAGGQRASHNTTFVMPSRYDRQTQTQIAQENRRQLERSQRLTA